MKKIFRVFYISFAIYLGLVSIFFFIHLAKFNLDEISFTISYLPTFFIFYLPMFISFLAFRKENNKVSIFLSAIISFIVTYISIYFVFKYTNHNNLSRNFFSVSLILIGILGLFTSLFVSAILTILDKNKSYLILKLKIYPQNKILLTIPLIGILVYSLMVFMGSPNFFSYSTIWTNILPFGILLSYISFYCFKYFYSNFFKTKRIIFLVMFYLLGTLFFVLLSNVPFIIRVFKYLYNEDFFQKIFISIILFAPFFLYVIIVVHLYFLNLINKQEKSILSQKSLESQLNYQQLKNQLSPHFLFNNINVLTSLIEENPKKAVLFSENLSHIYRYFLEQEKQDVVLVKDEITFAKSYLELLKNRFEVGLNFTISVNENVNEKYIVSTILQQVLENVVKHNAINENEKVEVKILSEENYLIVKNNKNLKISLEKTNKKGIENIKKRIAFFTDEKVIINDSETHFIIKLPILETV
ncbi:MAG: sensor histidine kinase [Polaribacter sp.]